LGAKTGRSAKLYTRYRKSAIGLCSQKIIAGSVCGTAGISCRVSIDPSERNVRESVRESVGEPHGRRRSRHDVGEQNYQIEVSFDPIAYTAKTTSYEVHEALLGRVRERTSMVRIDEIVLKCR
jgi:hypothetical protein